MKAYEGAVILDASEQTSTEQASNEINSSNMVTWRVQTAFSVFKVFSVGICCMHRF